MAHEARVIASFFKQYKNIIIKKTKKKIDNLLSEAAEIGVEWLTNHLQKMLKDNPRKIDEIINRMGTTAFYKKNEPLWSHECEELKGYSELSKFMAEYDSVLGLTGYDIELKRT